MDDRTKSAIPTRGSTLKGSLMSPKTTTTLKSFNVKRLSEAAATASPSKRVPLPESPLTQPARRQSLATPRILNTYGMKTSTTSTSVAKKSSASVTRRRVEEERIKVCVRKRPVSIGEREIVQLDTREQSFTVECTKTGLDGYSKANGLMKFFFDHVFDDRSSNESVYKIALKPLVQAFIEKGTKCTCFAYGQTGSGKTHTVLGNNGDGLVFQAARDLLYYDQDYLQFSFYEIYRGNLFDLLANRRKILACEQDGVVKILGLKQVNLFSLEQVEDLISQGTNSRKVGSSSANEQSSRSHAIMQFSSLRTGAKLLIVDLAGSERGADQLTGATPTTRLEGAEINKSLLALKECIRAMDLDAAHLPFRQSKLTQVLRDAFVGVGSLTTMIATVSPTLGCYENTLNTLRYADRVKELKGEMKENSQQLLIDDTPTKPPVIEEVLLEKTPCKKQRSGNNNSLLKLAITNNSSSASTTPRISAKKKIGALLDHIRSLTEECEEGEEEVLELVKDELESIKVALLTSLH